MFHVKHHAVADGAPKAVWAFHDALYEQQPEENSEGLSDDQIADLATRAGVPEAVVDRFTEGTYRPWVEAATEAAGEAGVQQTPTVKINDEVFEGDVFRPGALTQAIESAAGS